MRVPRRGSQLGTMVLGSGHAEDQASSSITYVPNMKITLKIFNL